MSSKADCNISLNFLTVVRKKCLSETIKLNSSMVLCGPHSNFSDWVERDFFFLFECLLFLSYTVKNMVKDNNAMLRQCFFCVCVLVVRVKEIDELYVLKQVLLLEVLK